MGNDQPDFTELARSLPCDKELLPELGRVSWAAEELHRGVRELIDRVRGAASEWPVNLSLAGAIRELEAVAERHAGRDAAGGGLSPLDVLLGWCHDVGLPAARSRDGVVEQVVHGPRDDDRVQYGRDDLVEVTGRLVNAARTLPRRSPGSPGGF